MKKLFSTLAVVALSALSLNAQIKEGTITYAMTVEGLPPEQAAMMGDMEVKMTFKENKSLMELSTVMMSQLASINEKGMTLVIEAYGNKMAVVQTKEEMDKEEAKLKDKSPDPKIEYTSETKTIAGYECKKAVVTMLVGKDKKEEKIDVWYSDKFNYLDKDGKTKGEIKGLKGVPFEYFSYRTGFKSKLIAKEVSTEPVSDDKFVLSTEGCKMMTMDELKSMGREGK
jgi:hypothetical protein